MARLAQGEICVTELAEAEHEEYPRFLSGYGFCVPRISWSGGAGGKHINYALTDQHMLDIVTAVIAHAGEPAAVANETETEKGEA